MEGWDATLDGRPTDLVRRRWARFGASGAGLVWAEATAVRPDGRANPNQLLLDGSTVDDLAGLREPARARPGRRAAADALRSVVATRRCSRRRAPRTATRCSTGGSAPTRTSVLSGDELDELARDYVDAAVLAERAGFDFVDVKACHGYLLHELLSAHDRADAYGGTLEGRTRFLRTVIEGIRRRAPAPGGRRAAVGVRPGAPRRRRRRGRGPRGDGRLPPRLRR